MQNVTLRQLIKVAYNLRSDSQVVGGPDWVDKAHFDINARMDDEEFARIDKMTPADEQKESQLLLQRLLADRFGLHVSMAARPLSHYALVVDGAASKLAAMAAATPGGGENLSVHNGHLEAKSVPMESLVSVLADQPEAGDRVVLNRTGLDGKYDFQLNWTSERGSGVTDDAAAPGLFTALREQLGLKMQREEGDVPVVLLERAEAPQLD